MYKIKLEDKIATIGLGRLSLETYEIGTGIAEPDAILVRSKSLLDMSFPPSLLAVGRAGAGVNNIPVDACTERGIVVFNTPGANANAVKEMVLASMLAASRGLVEAVAYTQTLKGRGAEIPEIIEKEKNRFRGQEVKGKKLGVVGLGAIGVMVANDAVSLGMEVEGYDPFISVDAAWGLSRDVKRARGLDRLIATSDYITLHVPLTSGTKGMINAEKMARMKKGVYILNFSRGGIVNNADILRALGEGTVARYVTDFVEDELLEHPRVLCVPHLGAGTQEAQDNCAVMIVDQVRDFLEAGSIVNAVNFPECHLDRTTNTRVLIVNRNVPNMVGQITTVLAAENLNIVEMLNKSKDNIAYTIVDVSTTVGAEVVGKLRRINGVISVRVI